MTYQSFIDDLTTNDAVIEAVAVALTLSHWVRGACQDAIDSGRIVRRWWDNDGRVYAAMAALVLLFVACIAMAMAQVTYRWLRDCGVPMALRGLDVTCRFLLCYEDEPVLDESELDKELSELTALGAVAEGQIAWARAQWPQWAA